jgi:hypothetical protein
MASLYWNGPWTRIGYQFDVTSLNSEEYPINVSPIHEGGILGDVSVIVAQIGPSIVTLAFQSLCFHVPQSQRKLSPMSET